MTRPLFLALLPLLAACATPPHPPAAADAPKPYTLADLRIPDTPAAMPRERRAPEKRPTRGQSRDAVSKANAAALELPALPCFVGKACEYWYQPDRHFLVHMGVLNQTLVCLKPGEVIRDIVAPGAQVWIPHQPYSYGSGRARTECIAFMPRRAGLDHQISVFTDQRKYDLNVMTWARSHHVEVRWRYPEDVLAALNRTRADADPDAGGDRSAGVPFQPRSCAYRIEGATPAWRPAATADGEGEGAVCDDGRSTLIRFRPGVLGAYGAPTVWRLEADGTRVPVQYGRMNATYRVAGLHERLLLGLGAEEVTITRTAP